MGNAKNAATTRETAIPFQFLDLSRMLTEGLLRNAEEIARIHRAGEIAVLFYDLGDSVRDGAREDLGWSGKPREVVRLTPARRERLLDQTAASADGSGRSAKAVAETLTWLRRPHGARVYALYENLSLCLDFDEGSRLWSIAPGTLDPRFVVYPTGLDPSFGPGMVRAAALAGDRVTFRVNGDHCVELVPVTIGSN